MICLIISRMIRQIKRVYYKIISCLILAILPKLKKIAFSLTMLYKIWVPLIETVDKGLTEEVGKYSHPTPCACTCKCLEMLQGERGLLKKYSKLKASRNQIQM